MKKLENTQYFKIQSDQELQVGEVLHMVYQAMTEKGYDPVNQIVVDIMSCLLYPSPSQRDAHDSRMASSA